MFEIAMGPLPNRHIYIFRGHNLVSHTKVRTKNMATKIVKNHNFGCSTDKSRSPEHNGALFFEIG